MRTSNMRARKFSSAVGKILVALIFASMVGGISIAPAFGDDKDRREWNQKHDQYKHDQYKHEQYKHNQYKHDRRVYQSSRRYYSEPLYAPPPFFYRPEPYQSPGLYFVFPIQIR